jgi:proteasome lid subunit RPN8/RPN11
MGFSILRTIRVFAAPEHRVSCGSYLWKSIVAELCRRTEMRHESGAFLLGTIEDGRRRILRPVYYDDLDAKAYSQGICVVRGPAFAQLWKICRKTGYSVVADIHVHPGEAFQSSSDKTNPTLPNRGHISIIVPHFAKSPVRIERLGIFEYLGGYRWKDLGQVKAREHLYIGLCG